ncbi:MAG: rhomboid family intramembrane serine protease [Verrucomicrobiota bacterium]
MRPLKNYIILSNYVQNQKITFGLVVLNIIVFLAFGLINTTPLALLSYGANFAPYSLRDEPYRLITSMFLHGNIVHLLLNMYSLVALGNHTERKIGVGWFVSLYIVAGLSGSMLSASYNLFVISVGASGAIFGIYAFDLLEVIRVQKSNRIAVITNFVIYVIFMYWLGRQYAFLDNAAHLGGFIGGVVIYLLIGLKRSFKTSLTLIIPSLIIIYLLLPRMQVRYFEAFQYMIRGEESIYETSSQELSNSEFAERLEEKQSTIDTMALKFKALGSLPRKLDFDRIILLRYFDLLEQKIEFMKRGALNESYIFIDSVNHMSMRIDSLPRTYYSLNMTPIQQKGDTSTMAREQLQRVTEWYDEDWAVTNKESASFYRLGTKDSLNNWHDSVLDFYIEGQIQMKGNYARGLKDGIFIYYNKDSTYSEAGVYSKDFKTGKWEYYYSKNRLESEYYYDKYDIRLMNRWTRSGEQPVKNGEGSWIRKDSTGFVLYKRDYQEGKTNGWVEGYYKDHSIHYREYFENGRLISGASISPDGSKHSYDFSTHFARPSIGNEALVQYFEEHNDMRYHKDDYVEMRFEVDEDGSLKDIRFLKSLGNPYDSHAKQLLIDGPKWLPAESHGYDPYTQSARATVRFKGQDL